MESTKTPSANESLPPRVPEDPDALDRAIMLLGSCDKHPLRPSRRLELIRLVGAYPAPEVARAWKRVLKDLRRDEIWLTTPAAAPSNS